MSVTMTSTGLTFSDGTSQTSASANPTYGGLSTYSTLNNTGTYNVNDTIAGSTFVDANGSSYNFSGTWKCMAKGLDDLSNPFYLFMRIS